MILSMNSTQTQTESLVAVGSILLLILISKKLLCLACSFCAMKKFIDMKLASQDERIRVLEKSVSELKSELKN
jgi:hypothetical protein